MHTFLLSVVVSIVVFWQTCYCLDQSNTISCGESVSVLETRITHGWEADSSTWPWHAAIFRRGNDTDDYICGATLVGQSFVVTAAHCVVNRATGHKLNPKLFSIHLGRQYLNESSTRVQEIPVEKILIHPQFLHVGLKNDIALMSLKTKVQFNEYVLPVCLDKSSQTDLRSDDLVGKEGMVVGWGKTENGEVSMTLQTAMLPVIDRIACLNSDPQFFSQLISYGMFCAGYENGTSVCNGDSGSGMYFLEGKKWMLRGIVSFSGLKADRISCDFHKYAGFTNVRYYVPWIRTIVNDGTSLIDASDANDLGISSRVYTCNYATSSSNCELSNIHLTQGATVGFNASNTSPTHVTLQRSYLQVLPKNLIEAFPALEYVNLQNLRMRNFEPNAFKTAGNLLTVNLQMNRLEEISRNAFEGAHSLVALDLSSNRIEFIDELAFNSIASIKHLNLSGNKMTNLPAFSRNNDLEILNASYNLLSDVSADQFLSNRQLHTLDMAHNRLTHLDLQRLDANPNLDTIDLSFNQLKRLHIPKTAKHLFARNNSIDAVSAETCAAETLNLSANKLQSFPTVSNCTMLKVLDLSNNLLESFNYTFIAQMQYLESLDLSHNHLLEVDLPLKINPVPRLKVLDLSHNSIIHGPSTNALSRLETLQLSHNELQQFDFSQIKRLQNAYLSKNRWDCSVIQGLGTALGDRDLDSCSEGFRKVHAICCKDYKHVYGDMWAEITLNNFIRDVETINYLKAHCLKPTNINNTIVHLNADVLEQFSKIVEERNKLQADLNNTLQVQLELTESFKTINDSLQSLQSKTSAITDIIERQRILLNSTSRDGKSDLKLLQEIFISLVTAVRSTYNKLRDYKDYIKNIPYRIRELNRAKSELKRQVRDLSQDLNHLEHEENSLSLHYNSLTRVIQNMNYAPTRNNHASTTYQQSSQGGYYSEQSYRYEYHSSSGG